MVAIVGDVDLATVPGLGAHLDTVEGGSVAIDLSGVHHFDPLGFGLVLSAALRASRRGAEFAVVCPQGRPRELFAETGVDRLVDVVSSVADLPGASDLPGATTS